MPSAALKSLAIKAGKSITAAERDWDHAKKIVTKEYGYKKDNPRYWALVTGVVKKMLGLKEAITFKEFVELNEMAFASYYTWMKKMREEGATHFVRNLKIMNALDAAGNVIGHWNDNQHTGFLDKK